MRFSNALLLAEADVPRARVAVAVDSPAVGRVAAGEILRHRASTGEHRARDPPVVAAVDASLLVDPDGFVARVLGRVGGRLVVGVARHELRSRALAEIVLRIPRDARFADPQIDALSPLLIAVF